MLELTGERVIPKLMKPTNGLLLEHIARYYFATPYTKGRVLDIACGAGYGTHMIGKKCKKEISEVIGVDIDADCVKYAKKNYFHPKVSYEVGDIFDNDLHDRIGQFDTILSFETIEHVEDENLFMRSLLKILKPGGTLVISTPFGKGKGIPSNSPFHVHQFTKQEFINIFNNFNFQKVEIYFQRGVTIEPARKDVHYPIGVAVLQKAD